MPAVASRTSVSWPRSASARAIASPTAPAPTTTASTRSNVVPRASARSSPLRVAASPGSVAIARQLAIEDAHHRLEEEALALAARVAVVGIGRASARGDLVREHLDLAAGGEREDLVAADALDPVQAPVRLRHRHAGDDDAVVLHE